MTINKDTKLYITPEHEVLRGEAAEARLNQNNDLHYLGEQGVVAVDRSRWETAQQYEKRIWMVVCRHNQDDRNFDHAHLFDDYRALSGKTFDSVIELGCGPFTNMRLILEHITPPKKITLLDPLIDDYKDHPHCAYGGGLLKGLPATLIPSSIEAWTPSEAYDLVVMVNVLEHCFDAALVLDTLRAALKPSGVLVFAEKVFRQEDVATVVANQFDAGHPIRVGRELVEGFIRSHFTPIHHKTVEGLYDEAFRIDIYMIGTYAAAAAPMDTPAHMNQKAERLFAAGFVLSAQKQFHTILARDPDNIDAVNNLGVIAYSENRMDEAMAYFQRALGIDAVYVEAMENMGRCLLYENAYAAAAQWFAKAARQQPENVVLLNDWGNCLMQAEDFNSAKSVFLRSYELAPDQNTVKQILAELNRLEKEGKRFGKSETKKPAAT